MFRALSANILNKIESFHLIGDGNISHYKALFEKLDSPFEVIFTGGLNRNDLNKYYSKAHLIILPSDSEGFPKVIAEAAAFGCVPAVSDVSSIYRYINDSNGLLFTELDPKIMAKEFSCLISARDDLKCKSENIRKIAPLFSFQRFKKRVREEILPRLWKLICFEDLIHWE